MRRPKKVIVNVKNFNPSEMVDDMISSGNLVIGFSSSIDETVRYNEYWEAYSLGSYFRMRKRRHLEYYETQQDAMAARMDAGTGYYKEMAGEEGQEILDKFDREAPFVGLLAKAATERAEAKGFVTTIFNRHLHFEQRDDGSFDYTHKALNRVIQGSSADQTKLALVEIRQMLIYNYRFMMKQTGVTALSQKPSQ